MNTNNTPFEQKLYEKSGITAGFIIQDFQSGRVLYGKVIEMGKDYIVIEEKRQYMTDAVYTIRFDKIIGMCWTVSEDSDVQSKS